VGGAADRDNNIRAAVIHVMADAAVSVLLITGLVLAQAIRDTGAILLDMNPDRSMADKLRQTIESDGDALADLHLWRLGPGHLGAIVSICTKAPRRPDYYRAKLAPFRSLRTLLLRSKVPNALKRVLA